MPKDHGYDACDGEFMIFSDLRFDKVHVDDINIYVCGTSEHVQRAMQDIISRLKQFSKSSNEI